MKTITTRRFLIPATLLVGLGVAGVSLARPDDTKNPQSPSQSQSQSQPQSRAQPQVPTQPQAPATNDTTVMRRGRLGISVLPISEELRAKLGAARDRGVLVDTVRSDAPAAKAGLRVGDVITAVDGDAVQSAADIVDAMSDRKRGQGVTMSVVRDGHSLDLNATLDTDPSPRAMNRMGEMRGMRGMPGMPGMEDMMGSDDFGMPSPGGGTWRWLREPGAEREESGGAQQDKQPQGKQQQQQQLDELRDRLDHLEQRLDRLEQR